MANFVIDNNDLNFPKMDIKEVPSGKSNQYISAADWNELCQGTEDVRDWIRGATWYGLAAQAMDPTPAGITSYIWLKADGTLWKTHNGTATEIGVGGGTSTNSVGPDNWGPAGNMPTGYVHNYDEPTIVDNEVIRWKGADNEGTVLTGMKPYTLGVGVVRWVINPSVSEQDVGTVTLKHEDPNSDPANRFCLPGEVDHQVDIHGVTILMRGYNGAGQARWLLVGTTKYRKALIQALHLYPNAQIGTPASPLSGSLNDYNPTGVAIIGSGLGIAGNDQVGKNHTFWRMFVDAAGATLTGIYGSATNSETEDFGRVHLLYNHGPGTLTVAHLSASSLVENRIYCPGEHDLKVPMYGAVWLIKPYYGVPDPGVTVQWRVIGTSLSNQVFPSVTTAGAVTTKQLIMTPAVTPATLASFATPTSNLNPGTNGVIRITPHANGSVLDGLIPIGDGDTREIVNVGTGPLILLDESNSASTAGNRFMLPAAKPLVIPSRFSVLLRFDNTMGGWLLRSMPPQLEAYPTFIVPSALPATNVNDYEPTDSTTGLPGRYAYWWKIAGAVGTNITGIKVNPNGLPTFKDGDRILLTNGGSGLTIVHASGLSALGNRIYCPGGSNVVLAQFGGVELVYHGGASCWLLSMKAS